MKILFNYQIFYQQKYGGISNYFFNLYNSLKKKNLDIRIIAPLHKNYYLKQIKKDVCGNYLPFLPQKISRLTEFFNYEISKYYFNVYKPNIVHDTYYFSSKYNNHKKTQKRVCTVYDMINELFSIESECKNYISNMKKNTIFSSDHIFCISNQTKNDLINLFNIDEKKISVTYLASSLKKKNTILKKKNLQIFCYLLGAEVGIKILIIL